MSEAAITLSAVSHHYGDKVALDAVSLEVPAGATVAVIGPDGVGKSTLLGLIAGVRALQTGQVRVQGGDMADAKHRDLVAPRIAYMPQGLGRNLYPTLSVAENIDFFGRLFGQSAAERRQRIDRLLRATGLDPFPDRPAGKLSGGMKQKLSLCCSLIHDPDLLILDEPTTGVDPLSRRQFWSLIDNIRAERPGMTVIVATAYMEEAARFQHLVVVDEGRVLAAGPMQAVLQQAGADNPEQAFANLAAGGGAGAALVMPPRVLHDGPDAIVADGLTRRFGAFTAVDHVSFRIAKGEIFGFLGSNGCGKTTTMKMLTGLLPATEGTASLLGRPIGAADMQTRLRVGYMSQSFSLYEELSVRANLLLHARLYRMDAAAVQARTDEALQTFGLAEVADELPASLPLGIRQRLQLAAACLHKPDVLILDEPTSGVDPAARDLFWRHLADLSRRDGVTIFVSTHFMNEAERCDRISLMHSGRVLAVGTPVELRDAKGGATLEESFITFLEEASPSQPPPAAEPDLPAEPVKSGGKGELAASFGRIWAFARREMTEVLRDRIRLAFALIGPLILLLTFGYGITFDVENLPYAVFDRDQSLESRQLVENLSGSRYFQERAPVRSDLEIERRLRSGELRLVVAIPPSFGRDLLTGHQPELAVYLDGAMPFRAETARGYVQGIAQLYARELLRRSTLATAEASGPIIQPRFRYNQSFRSANAILPGVIMVVMIMIPGMLTAIGVVREREIGSIANLYASPASVPEFLLGKQMPYVVIGFVSLLILVATTVLLFGVMVNGSLAGLLLGGALYIMAATGLGLLVSTFVRTQVAAILVTAIISVVPAINFSGFLYPASTLEGGAALIGRAFPSLWFQTISLGAFAKARDFSALHLEFVMLGLFALGFMTAASLLLRKQEA
ncbi:MULTISPECIES: ribosome-associated ATPase/putative transporter RbbA [unclassified Azospirillum]|uniref:ribosome-associated ATPase/putative transporter RbbA n=1 Tax=unclassified Azospirillum TaxID=2630922 RepID=UPI000B70CC8E|nr:MULTISPECIES: ribosome-associated ATPase/putative transporter RbbA [unclassified Azospirillum]SNS70687.1 ribosome-dependent ATPase [Azospirillum sp. RU38E]SNS88942.1 ribosome-dependent ATPase [Azospirillum sp. RU37A]